MATWLTRALFLALGLWLLWLVLSSTDLGAVVDQVLAIGLSGLALVVAIYAIEFVADTGAWLLACRHVPASPRWLGRLLGVRLVGEVLNSVTPLGGFGGEPVKALLLRRHHGLGIEETAISLILAKTANLLSMLLFLAVGFAFALGDSRLPAPYKLLASSGLLALGVGVLGLYAVQRHRVPSRLTARLGRTRLGIRLLAVLHHVERFDERLASFYVADRARFAGAFGLALANWVVGALGIYATFALIGRPVSLVDAWIIETVAQLVRAATFFIPASLGAQEGAFVLLLDALAGDAAAGLAAALVRRARELVWLTSGVVAGALYSARLPGREK
ncbi:MAG: flippase-like domain-containing protein [Ectothiorhodospiraceae bacterium]|nr:flippase-like domain-containing protein [Chromatiales bacterium]MCP5155710.1 flippase-like domain-containing protein [Ectothiorhodospiraceae bacterium]